MGFIKEEIQWRISKNEDVFPCKKVKDKNLKKKGRNQALKEK